MKRQETNAARGLSLTSGFSLTSVLAVGFLPLALLTGCDDKTDVPDDSATQATSAAAIEAKPKTPAKSEEAAPREKDGGASEAFGQLPDGVGLAKGSAVPEATVRSMDGSPVEFSELAAKGPTLLVFYRGGWCPFCNFQIHQLAKAHAEFESRGVSLVAVSVDQPKEGAKTKASYEIPFPVLSDGDLSLHRGFRVLNELDQAYIDKLKGKGMDVLAHSGKSHRTVAVPSVFLLVDGKVAFAHAEENYRVRPSTKQLFDMLDENGFPKK